jgi:hypothetical protein
MLAASRSSEIGAPAPTRMNGGVRTALIASRRRGNREQETPRSWDEGSRGGTRREPDRRGPEQRWSSERREGFNLFGGFECR